QSGKWRKLAGILTEMSAEADRTHWIVMGIGLNVHNRLPQSLASIGVSLEELGGSTPTRGEILTSFFETFRPMYQRWLKLGFHPFRKGYWQLHRDTQAPLRLKTAQGLVAGQARGVDDSGALIIESRREIHHLLEGEIIS